MNRIFWLVPLFLVLVHVGMTTFANGARDPSARAQSRAAPTAEPSNHAPVPPDVAGGSAPGQADVPRCKENRPLADRYQKALFQAAEAAGPESVFDVGADNPALAEKLRERVGSQIPNAPPQSEVDVSCRGSACRIRVLTSGSEPRQALAGRLQRAVRTAVSGWQAQLSGPPPLGKGASPEGQRVEFVYFVQVRS